MIDAGAALGDQHGGVAIGRGEIGAGRVGVHMIDQVHPGAVEIDRLLDQIVPAVIVVIARLVAAQRIVIAELGAAFGPDFHMPVDADGVDLGETAEPHGVQAVIDGQQGIGEGMLAPVEPGLGNSDDFQLPRAVGDDRGSGIVAVAFQTEDDHR